MYLLFGRVRKLVLATSIVAFLDAGVGPQCPDGVDVLLFKCCNCLVVYLSYQLAVFLSARHTVDRFLAVQPRHCELSLVMSL